MNSWYRAFAVVGVLLTVPRVSTAAPDCPQSIDDFQRQLQVFDGEARALGSSFLRDDGLGVSLEAFKKRLAAVSAQDRLSPDWVGLREADEAKNKLLGFDERVKRWEEGIAGYTRCLNNPSCSMGDLIKQHEISNREFAAWLKSFADEGLERATERLDRASAIMKNFTAKAGSPTTGAMASTLTCAAENSPRSLATAAGNARPDPGSGGHPTLNIEHQPVACAVAEKFPRLEARFTPAETIAKAQVLFQGENVDEWFGVVMKPEGTTFSGVLPKPKKSLRAFRYYIEVTDTALETNRTADYTTSVVESAALCSGKTLAGTVVSASVVLLGPVGGAAVPAGFASIGVVAGGTAGGAAGAASATAGGGGGLSTGAIVGIAAGVGGIVAGVAAKGGGSDAPPASSGPTAPAPAPTPAPAPPPPPPPAPTPTPGVAQYDGNYRGGFNGSFAGSPVNGPVAYSVSNGRLTLTEPGDGSGTVEASGSANFGGRVNLGIGVDCSFNGAFQGGAASGTWSCTGSGSSGSGSWNAQRQ